MKKEILLIVLIICCLPSFVFGETSIGDILPNDQGECREITYQYAWCCGTGTYGDVPEDGFRPDNYYVEYRVIQTDPDGRIVYEQKLSRTVPADCPVEPPPPCKQSDIDQAKAQCGEGNVVWEESTDPEFPQCKYHCDTPDCQDERQALEQSCAGGIKSFDYQTCTGECVDCNDYLNYAEEECRDYGGLYSAKCEITDSPYPNEQKYDVSRTCNGPDNNPDVPPGDTGDGTDPNNPTDPNDPNNPTPPDPNDPNNQPTPDPTPDPNNTPDQNNTALLDAIKQDNATIVDQNNVQIGQLSDIVSNTATIANNQGAIQDELRHNSDVTRDGANRVTGAINDLQNSNETGFSNLTTAINGIPSGTTNNIQDQHVDNSVHNGIEEVDFSQLSTSGTAPNVPEFDSTIPTDKNYTEYDDGTTLATDSAATYAAENLTVDPENNPINAEITASGDPCLNGNISVHGQSIPVSICFNKPWMLQGYAVMKLLFIGLGYLQTAILLNRAITA